MTRFGYIGRPWAVLLLALLALAVVGLLAVSLQTSIAAGAATTEEGDLALYRAIVEQMRGGSDYYVAAHEQMVARGYGTLSVFNWRTPLLAWLVSLSPAVMWAQAVFMALALGTATVVGRLMFGLGGRAFMLAGLVLMVVTLVSCFVPQSILFSEVPAGALILLSAALYGLDKRGWGQATAVLALFLRELAGLYVLVCMFMAWREKRYRELAVWSGVLCVYALYFGWHYLQVQAHIGPDDLGYKDGWLQLGGAGFVLKTAAFNGFFMLAPLWVSALVLPMALLGLAAWPGRVGQRMGLTVVGYIVVFAFVGKAFNDYWGALYTPVLTLGLGWFPFAMRDLLRVAIGAKPVLAVP